MTFLAPAGTAQELAPFATVTIQGEISDEVADFIAEQSVQSSSLRTSGPIADLVRENCGFVSPNNLKVFERAVVKQGGAVTPEGTFLVPGTITSVPACLPDEQELRLIGRLPSQIDTWSQIYVRDVDAGYYQSLHKGTPQSQQVRPPEIVLGAGVVRIDEFRKAGVDLSRIAGDAVTPPATAEVAEAITGYLQTLNVDPNDRSRVAYETFAVSTELRGAGLDPETTRQVVARALDNIGSADRDQVLSDVDAALRNNQQVPRIDEIPGIGETCVTARGLCDAEASGAIVRLDQVTGDIATVLNPRYRVLNNETIYSNVPLLSVERVVREAKIELLDDSPAPEGVVIAESLPNDPGKVRLFLNVFDAVDDSTKTCAVGDYANWATDDFRARFRKSLGRSLALKVERDEQPNDTDTLILDGGFFRFEAQSFGGADWRDVPSFGRHADAASLTDMPPDQFEKIVHGTAVTSIALGGPGLMDIGLQLSLPIKTESRPIYKIEPQSGQEKYVLISNIDSTIADTPTDIVNISFGTTNDNDAQIRAIKETLLLRDGKLLIVAAGNLGNNDNSAGGIEVSGTGLAPQSWGGDQEGKWNMIVVAGLDPTPDPTRLAWFSNFGNDIVFLGAPACRVPALRATEQGTYEEAAFNGTSFAAPIVTFVAAAVRTVMPRLRTSAPWIRARLLATADIEPGLGDDEISQGRVLNPVDAVLVYEDIVTLKAPLPDGRQVLTGKIQTISGETDISKGSLCDQQFNSAHHLLRLFRRPIFAAGAAPAWEVDLMGPQDKMVTQSCTPRGSQPLVVLTDRGSEPLRIDMIDDIKFAFDRRIE